MGTLTLAQATSMAFGAMEKAQELKLQPLAVVILDAGGHPLLIQRQDGATNLRVPVATGKASGAIGLGINSRRIAEMAAERPVFVSSLAQLAANGVVPAAGGVIIKNSSGALLGAIGISGDTSDNDELCGAAGIRAAGLIPGEPA